MNKSELIDRIRAEANVTRNEAETALNAALKVITETLQSSEPVQIIGFGTFDVRNRAARTGRNPRTGETLQIAASRRVAFKAGKSLQEAVN